MKRRRVLALGAVIAALAVAFPVMTALGEGDGGGGSGQLSSDVIGSGFTYQGRLLDDGEPANGAYDLRFTAWDAANGGAQQGSTITLEDVNVTNGLFTVLLDFGAGVFTGAPRHLQVEVKPGASGSFTALTPRQLLAPVPYAIYAANAPGGGLSFGASISGDSPTTGLTVEYTGAAGNGIVVTTSGSPGAAIHAETSGSGVAVEGLGTTADGEGGKFITSHPSGTALQGIGAGSGSTALEVNNGAIKVAGTTRPAFVHEATSGNNTIACLPTFHCTAIDHPLTNGNPDAILIVTQLFGSTAVFNDHPVGVWYSPLDSKWTIFNLDEAGMPDGALFNVLVISQ